MLINALAKPTFSQTQDGTNVRFHKEPNGSYSKTCQAKSNAQKEYFTAISLYSTDTAV